MSDSHEEWERVAKEPASDELIESYRREAKTCHCLSCLEKMQLIARIDQMAEEIFNLRCEAREHVCQED